MVTKFQMALHKLLMEEPYYANFVLNAVIEFDTRQVPTATALADNSQLVMVFNTKFLEKFSVEEVAAVIKHEVLHLVLDHTSIMKESKEEYLVIWNIAMDCAINQYISNLPKDGVLLKDVEKICGKKLVEFETSHYYFEQMKPKADEILEKLKTLDEHMEDRNTPKELRKSIIKSASKKAAKASAGNVPQAVLKSLEEVEAKLPWKNLLRNFVATNTSSRTKSSYKKLNRRFALPVPGKSKIRKLKLGVCADSSGSVSDKDYADFLGEIRGILKSGAEVFFVDADCEVQSAEMLKTAKDLKMERRGSGGTAYQPAIDACMAEGCTAIVYFGDFDCADIPKNPKVPFLWVGVGESPAPGNFGKVIRL